MASETGGGGEVFSQSEELGRFILLSSSKTFYSQKNLLNLYLFLNHRVIML